MGLYKEAQSNRMCYKEAQSRMNGLQQDQDVRATEKGNEGYMGL